MSDDKHPDDCDCDPCLYSDDVQKGAMYALIAEQVKNGYFEHE